MTSTHQAAIMEIDHVRVVESNPIDQHIEIKLTVRTNATLFRKLNHVPGKPPVLNLHSIMADARYWWMTVPNCCFLRSANSITNPKSKSRDSSINNLVGDEMQIVVSIERCSTPLLHQSSLAFLRHLVIFLTSSHQSTDAFFNISLPMSPTCEFPQCYHSSEWSRIPSLSNK
jgi:hypothetical protein